MKKVSLVIAVILVFAMLTGAAYAEQYKIEMVFFAQVKVPVKASRSFCSSSTETTRSRTAFITQPSRQPKNLAVN